MNTSRYNSRSAMTLDRMIDDFFKTGWSHFTGADTCHDNPAVNVVEKGEEFVVEMAAPGLKKGDFEIGVKDNVLTISAGQTTKDKEEVEASEEHTRYTRKEFSYAQFKRSFKLPKTIEVGSIEAAYEEGILVVTLPKKEEAKVEMKRMIAIS